MIQRLLPLAAGVLLFAGAATACGSTDSETKGKSTAASPSAKIPTADELQKKLLTLSDMPTGYSAKAQETSGPGDSPAPQDSSSLSATTAECAQLFNQFDAESSSGTTQGQATVKFEKSPTGPFVTETLESYADAAGLQKDMTRVREAVDKCHDFSMKEDDGSDVKVTIAAASFPKMGDETVAFRLGATVTNSGRSLTLGGYMVAVRVGNVVSTIIAFGLPGVDAAEVETITKKSVEKVTPIAR
jgi:hypothetical protein